jgi:alkylated DNA repair dioxygenase AlkB
MSAQSDLFTAEPGLPAGFIYRDGIISTAEEQALLERFEGLPFKPFEFHGCLGKRRVLSFGCHFGYAGGMLRDSDPIPPFLLRLHEQAAGFAGVRAIGLQQILINEYAPGAGIGWHRDKPMFEDVIAVSLSSPYVLRLRCKQGTGWERAQDVRPRGRFMRMGIFPCSSSSRLIAASPPAYG